MDKQDAKVEYERKKKADIEGGLRPQTAGESANEALLARDLPKHWYLKPKDEGTQSDCEELLNNPKDIRLMYLCFYTGFVSILGWLIGIFFWWKTPHDSWHTRKIGYYNVR
eukprot:Platyproteum_vivax@DN8325_c0_g1_i1.p1